MHFIIFDLEATCWDRSQQNNDNIHEIIEIGAVKLNDALEELSCFQTFVKPTKNPVLSDFCKELTHIGQDEVDRAPYFAQSLELFTDWALEGSNNITMLSWGYYDKGQS